MKYIKLQYVLDIELQSDGAFDYPTIKSEVRQALARGIATLPRWFDNAAFQSSVDIVSEVDPNKDN